MKNITLSADDHLIEAARSKARAEHTTLNQEFRDWLVRYTKRQQAVSDFDRVMKKISYFKTDKKYTREAMNKR